MSAGTVSIEEICQADRERLARMLLEQPPVTREAWEEQVKRFEKVRETSYRASISGGGASSL